METLEHFSPLSSTILLCELSESVWLSPSDFTSVSVFVTMLNNGFQVSHSKELKAVWTGANGTTNRNLPKRSSSSYFCLLQFFCSLLFVLPKINLSESVSSQLRQTQFAHIPWLDKSALTSQVDTNENITYTNARRSNGWAVSGGSCHSHWVKTHSAAEVWYEAHMSCFAGPHAFYR